MSTTRQTRGGRKAWNDGFVGAPRQVTADTESKELRLHDGATPGGSPIGVPLGGTEGQVLAKASCADRDMVWETPSASDLPSVSPQGRLSLTAGVAVPTSDVATATTIYYVPAVGNAISLYDGTDWQTFKIPELALPLDADSGHAGYQQAGMNWDVWAVVDNGAVRLATGPSWSAGAVAGSLNARGEGAGSSELQYIDGLPVNANAMTVRFGAGAGDTLPVAAQQALCLGTFHAIADGVTRDTSTSRLVANVFNMVERSVTETAGLPANYNYSSTIFRYAGNDSSINAQFLSALTGNVVKARIKTKVTSNTATYRIIGAGIRVDGSDLVQEFVAVNVNKYEFINLFRDFIANPGFHTVSRSEYGGGVDTQTWIGGTDNIAVLVLA